MSRPRGSGGGGENGVDHGVGGGVDHGNGVGARVGDVELRGVRRQNQAVRSVPTTMCLRGLPMKPFGMFKSMTDTVPLTVFATNARRPLGVRTTPFGSVCTGTRQVACSCRRGSRTARRYYCPDSPRRGGAVARSASGCDEIGPVNRVTSTSADTLPDCQMVVSTRSVATAIQPETNLATCLGKRASRICRVVMVGFGKLRGLRLPTAAV